MTAAIIRSRPADRHTQVTGATWWARLRALRHGTPDRTAYYLTEDPGCQTEQLAEIAGEYVRGTVATNIALHPNTDILTLVHLVLRGDGRARTAVARRSDLPTRVYRTLLKDEHVTGCVVAANPAIGPAVHAEAVQHDALLSSALTNPICDIELLRRYAPERMYCDEIATNPACPPDVFATLWERRTNTGIVEGFASNPACPPEYLGAISTLMYPQVAGNPNCTAEQLAWFITHATGPTLKHLYQRADCPAAAYEIGAADNDIVTRLTLAEAPHCPSTYLEQLAFDPSPVVRRAAIAHPNCPAAVLEQLMAQPTRHQGALLANPNTPTSWVLAQPLEDLAGHSLEWTGAISRRLPALEHEEANTVVHLGEHWSGTLHGLLEANSLLYWSGS